MHYSADTPAWDDEFLRTRVLRILKTRAAPAAHVFELGCGNGSVARTLAAEGYTVTGVDPSESGIAIASRHAHERLRFEVGSTTDDLASRFGRFPVVISLEVIEHCPSAREFMRSFASLLAPGGLGILSTPYHGYVKNLAIVAAGRFDRHFNPLWEGGHVKFFTRATLRALFEEFGFRRFEIHRVGRVPVLARSMLAVIQNS